MNIKKKRKMELQLMTLIFRTFTIILSLVIAANAYSKYHHRMSKAWLYVSGYGFSLFMWASFNLIFQALEIEKFRIAISAVLILSMALFLGLAATRFYRMRRHLISEKTTAIIIISIFLATCIVSYSLNGVKLFFFQRMVTSSVFVLIIVLGYSLFVSFKIMKKFPWVLTIAALIMGLIALLSIMQMGNCCAGGGKMQYMRICYSYNLDYTALIKFPCSANIVKFSFAGQSILLVAIALHYASMYMLEYEKEEEVEFGVVEENHKT